MFLIFALCRPNVLPCGDLAIRKGFMHAWRLKKEPDEKRMRQLALPYEGKYTDLSRTLWMMMDERNKK
jgi:DNA-3-methyladenine glycosylase II